MTVTTDLVFEKLTMESKEEYTDFLMQAYKDEFHSHLFGDHEAVKRKWIWEYVECRVPVKDKPLIWILRIKGRMAGQMCVMPVMLNVRGKLYKAGWCQDFIVLPEHRKKGIGYSIVRHVTEESKKYLDVLLAIVASEASYKVFQRASYIDIGFTSRNIKVLNAENIVNKLTENKIMRFSSGIAVRALFGVLGALKPLYSDSTLNILETGGFEGDLSSICSARSKNFPFNIEKDIEALRWRFINQPCWNYKVFVARSGLTVKGYIILREADILRGRLTGLKTGIIADISFNYNEKKVGMALLDRAIRYFYGRADIVRFDFLSKDLASIAGLSGFINIRSRNRCYMAPLAEDLKSKASGTFKNGWYLTYSDSDLDLS